MTSTKAPLYLVTGANGYIATHIVSQLLKEGYRVRGTVRNLNDRSKIEPLKKLAAAADVESRLEIVQADLMQDAAAWKSIVKDCTKILHVASPLPVVQPADAEQEIVRPALEGTLNVLNAAADEPSVERVVYTSSGLAVYGYKPEARCYSEADWPDVESLKGYAKSKYLAEKAAWNFVEERKKKNLHCFELVVVLPVFVLGPTLHSTLGTSETRFLNIFSNKVEKIPNLCMATCDVRDVALAHIRASIVPEAANQRHLIVSERRFIPMKRWVDILREEFSSKGLKFPTEVDEINETSLVIGETDNSRMRNVLKIEPTSFRSTVLDMAYNFIDIGRVKLHPQNE